jgi:hypothetical protein
MPRPPAPKSPAWVSVARASKILGVGERTVWKQIRTGKLTVRTLPGSHARLLESEVLALAAKFTAPATAS